MTIPFCSARVLKFFFFFESGLFFGGRSLLSLHPLAAVDHRRAWYKKSALSNSSVRVYPPERGGGRILCEDCVVGGKKFIK